MAKNKPVPKATAKKFVPTSAMFKSINRDKAQKTKAPKICFRVKKKGENDYCHSAVRKSKKIPDHPLAVAFTCIVFQSQLEKSMS